MKIDTLTTSKFVSFVTEGYATGKFWEVRLIKNGKVKPHFFKDIRKLKNFLTTDLSDWNVYLGVLPREQSRGREEDVKFGNLHFIDLDKEDAISGVEKIYQKLTELNLRPSLIVNSGHGLHIYFKLDAPLRVDIWKGLQERLILFFQRHLKEYKPDIALKDASRIMRVPGTINVKTEPVETSILIEDYSMHRIKDIEKVVGGKIKKTKTVKSKFRGAIGVIPTNIDALIRNGVREPERTHYCWIVIKELWKRGFDRDTIFTQARIFNSNCQPPRAKREVEYQINYLLKHAEKCLTDKVSEEWLRERGYGAIKERINNLDDVEDIIKKPRKPIEWLVEGWIPLDSEVLLAGKGGSYKSYLTEYLAVCLTSGKSFLGLSTKKCKSVLIIDMENDEEIWGERFEFMKRGMGIKEKLKIKVWHPDFLNLSSEGDYKKLINVIEMTGAEVIIFDTLIRMCGVDRYRAEEVSKFYLERTRPLLTYKKVRNIVSLHHLKKDIGENTEMIDLVHGSVDWVNHPRVVMGLRQNKRLPDKLHLYHLKLSRRKRQKPITIEMESDEPQTYTKFKVLSREEEEKTETEECYLSVAEWLNTSGVITFSTKNRYAEVGNVKKTFKYNIIRDVIRRMKDDGLIVGKRGKYTVIRENLRTFLAGDKD